MPKGDYFFKLYYQRLLTSTVGWKDDEFGAYMRLLIYQFDKGSIPSDINQIIRIAPSAKKHWPLLSQKFVEDGKGGLINNVMDDVRNERLKKSETMSEVGSRGGRPKKNLLVPEEKPNGFQKESNTNVSTGIMVNGSGKKEGQGEGKPLGSLLVNKISEDSWGDVHWRQQLCIGLNIKDENLLKRWMAHFNSSISNDFISGFNVNSYKKMIRGWILGQQRKGVTIENSNQPKGSTWEEDLKRMEQKKA